MGEYSVNHSSLGHNTQPLDQSETSIVASCPPIPAHLLQPVDAGGGAVVELRRCGHDAVLEQLRVAGTGDRKIFLKPRVGSGISGHAPAGVAVGLADHLSPVLGEQLRQHSLHLPVDGGVGGQVAVRGHEEVPAHRYLYTY